MSKQNKIYCGSGKQQNQSWITATINVAKIKDHIREYNGVKFVKVNINLKDESDKYGKDVEITVDTWQPTKDKVETAPNPNNDDLPF